jgi:acyl-CoA thioesterase FadM
MLLFYWRLFVALFRFSLFERHHKRIQVGETSTFHFVCSPFDCEYLRTMNAARIVSVTEVASHFNNLRNRFFQTCLKNKIWAINKRTWAVYRRPIRLFDKGRVESVIACWGTHRVFWYHRVYVGETLCTEVVAEVHLTSFKGKVTIEEAQRLMGVQVASPPVPENVMNVIAGHRLQTEADLLV